jgi:hypothetical protein
MFTKAFIAGVCLLLAGCAAREKAPEASHVTTCCVIRVTNQLATPIELDYTRFSTRQEMDPLQQQNSQSGTLSLNSEKIAAGQQQKAHVSQGTVVKIKYVQPSSGQVTQTELEVQDYLDVTVTAEGVQNQATPPAERPLLTL